MRLSSRRAPLIRTATVALVLALIAASSARAQVMDQVPADALVVLRVKNLQATSGKFGKFLTDLGVAAMVPGMDDPLKMLQQKLNIQQGLNAAGDMAFVYRDPAVSGEREDKSVVILIPVTDYKAFVGNFQNPKEEAGVTEVAMPEGAEPGYLANWGSFAALSPSKAVVSGKPAQMLKLAGEVAKKELDTKDVVLFANVIGLRGKFLPELQKGKEQILAQVEQGAQREQKTARFAPVIKAVVSQIIAIGETALRDTDAATIGLNFGAEGISLSFMGEFQPASYLATTVGGMANTNQALLKGLPSGKYLLYGGSVNNPATAQKILEDFTAPIVKEVDALGPEFKPVHDYVDALKQYVGANKSSTFGLLAPSGNLGAEPIIQFMTVATGDSAKMRESQQKMVTCQEQAMQAFGMPAGAMKATVTPAAKTVDGVTFDTIVTSVDPNSNDPMVQQQVQVMSMMYGPGGMNMLIGDVGGALLSASGVSDQTLTSAIAAVKGGQSPLSDLAGVKSVGANLPKNRLMEIYVPVDELATTGLTYARQFGAGINIQLPPDLPPIGAALSTEPNAMRFDVYVPSSLVQSLVAAGMQAAMQMQGGGGGGGGGL